MKPNLPTQTYPQYAKYGISQVRSEVIAIGLDNFPETTFRISFSAVIYTEGKIITLAGHPNGTKSHT